MLFSELYSVYYNTVAKIITSALSPGATEKDLQRCVAESAFSESVLTILPSLKSGKWPLLREDLSPCLTHVPTMPPTTLQLRWLKAISEDPRVKLFDVSFPSLDGVEPLFTREDYRIYDQYSDGDPFEDSSYIAHFRLILSAIRDGLPVQLTVTNRRGRQVRLRIFPTGLEYSLKDDKFRILSSGGHFRYVNLGRVLSCEISSSSPPPPEPQEERLADLTLLITDERNTLERAMIHFSHFERQAERREDGRYLLRLKYYESDETEVVIRVLSFGPTVRVLDPPHFVDLIRDRLIAQRNCGLK